MSGLFSRLAAILLIFLMFLVPTALFAADAGPSNVAEPPAAIALTQMTRVGEMSTLGVKATAYITPLARQAASTATHRVVVTLVNEKTGRPVEKAQVGLKLRRLYGATLEPVWMHASDAQPELFSAEIALIQPGTWLLIVGSKLQDDKKRQFTFEYALR